MNTDRPIPADNEEFADISLRAKTAVDNRISLNDRFLRLMAGAE